jgi:hypothetical protein
MGFAPYRSSRARSSVKYGAIYHRVLRKHAQAAGSDFARFGPHALRATAATNALDRGADLGKVQEWLGHANASTTRLYDRRRSRPELFTTPSWVAAKLCASAAEEDGLGEAFGRRLRITVETVSGQPHLLRRVLIAAATTDYFSLQRNTGPL